MIDFDRHVTPCIMQVTKQDKREAVIRLTSKTEFSMHLRYKIEELNTAKFIEEVKLPTSLDKTEVS